VTSASGRARTPASFVAALAAALALPAAACRPAPRAPLHAESPAGTWYVVEPGETLAQIAARSGAPAEDILEVNGFRDAAEVTAGRLIFVLDGRGGAAAAPASAAALPAQRPRAGTSDAAGRPPAALAPARPTLPSTVIAGALTDGAPRLRWPVAGAAVASPFGTRDGRPHDGIDLPAPIGTPVYAAGDGQVIYAGSSVRGYGNLVVVQHAGDLLTVYAHNASILVRAGDVVAAGQRLALVGQSGRASGPHLHFEVRQGQVPRDPLWFLPTPANTGTLGGTP
jgi:murein DD-endopeptidase MepM/ murein hydrolase activator NlpD